MSINTKFNIDEKVYFWFDGIIEDSIKQIFILTDEEKNTSIIYSLNHVFTKREENQLFKTPSELIEQREKELKKAMENIKKPSNIKPL